MPRHADALRCLQMEAERCYRLARGVTDPAAITALTNLGKELDAQIAALEAERLQGRAALLLPERV